MEWPPRSGRMGTFPEVERAEWVDLDFAEARLHKGQAPIAPALRSFLFKRKRATDSPKVMLTIPPKTYSNL